MQISPETFTVTDYLGRTFDCVCGHTHQTSLKEALIGDGVMRQVPALVEKLGLRRPLMICDLNTWDVAGQQLSSYFKEADRPCDVHIFKTRDLVPDENALGQVMMALKPHNDLIISVGTGSLNDLGKYASFVAKIPYFIAATAPSMDGFASIGAPLMQDNLKVTFDAHVPAAIIGDTAVLAAAPMDMIRAGLGDMLGKYTCLLDWKMSNIINGEYSCPTIVAMVKEAVRRITDVSEGVLQRDPAAIAVLMDGLVLTGIAMSFVGNSRPASGCEHHLSHFLEMRFLFDGRKAVLHGRKVAVSTVIAATLYHRLADEQIDFDAARALLRTYDESKWEEMIHRCYGKAAAGVIALEKCVGKNDPIHCLRQLDAMEQHWPELVSEMKALPNAAFFIETLKHLGAPSTPAELGIEKELLRDGINVAKEVRDRFTLWQMLWNLGLLPAYADWTVSHCYGRED